MRKVLETSLSKKTANRKGLRWARQERMEVAAQLSNSFVMVLQICGYHVPTTSILYRVYREIARRCSRTWVGRCKKTTVCNDICIDYISEIAWRCSRTHVDRRIRPCCTKPIYRLQRWCTVGVQFPRHICCYTRIYKEVNALVKTGRAALRCRTAAGYTPNACNLWKFGTFIIWSV